MNFKRIKVGAFFLFGVFATAVNAQEELELVAKDTLSVTLGPEAIELGDVTRDAVLDAVVVGNISTYNEQYYCFTGRGDGTFEPEPVFTGDVNNDPIDFVLGDFNNDTILDIAALNSGCG